MIVDGIRLMVSLMPYRFERVASLDGIIYRGFDLKLEKAS